jgi:DNA-binding IclR family transcriptional regulator
MNQESQTGLTQSVTRALKILRCFTDEAPLQRVSDISTQLKLTPSLVSRLLATLENEGFVERDKETGFYQLGKSILTLAGVALNHNRLRMEALSEMQRVVNTLGLGVNLAVLDGDTIFYVAHIDGPQAPRAYTLIGRRNPLHATGIGKILLAHLADDTRAHYLEHLPLPAYTVRTITEPEVLNEELNKVRTQGWALEMEELALGRACIAGPIRNQKGTVIAALSISGPLTTLSWEERREELINNIIEVTDLISMRLGYITAPRPSQGTWRPPLASQKTSVRNKN